MFKITSHKTGVTFFICLLCTFSFAVADQVVTPTSFIEDEDAAIEILHEFQNNFLAAAKGLDQSHEDETKRIFDELNRQLMVIMGATYTWPSEFRIAYQNFFVEEGFDALLEPNIRYILPAENEITEREAIRLAELALAKQNYDTAIELTDCIVFTEHFFRLSDPEKHIWTIYYVIESLDINYRYLMQFFVDINSRTGEILYLFPDY